MRRGRRRGRPAALAAAGLGLLAGLLAGGCGRSEGPPRHLLLITVDTLRADHLGAYGYPRPTSPAVDELAAGGVTFERAFAQWPKTGPSFASLFTGQYPQTTGLTHKAALRLSPDYLTFPELLTDLGFTSVAVISNAVLAQHLGWDQGFAEYHETWNLATDSSDDPAEYRKWINARRVNELALPLLERHRQADRLFAWIHYSDPHAPYLLPDGEENPFLGDAHYTGDELAVLDEGRAVALGDHRELRYYVAQYDANVLFTDRRIGELLAAARDLGLLRDALVVFTADHGESLGEHGYYFGHGRLPYNPGSQVPLIFSSPGRLPAGRRVEGAVELVSLYPTLLELLAPGRPVPGLEGRSLLPLLAGDGDRPGAADEAALVAFSQAGGGSPTTHYRSLQDRGWKLIYHPPLGERPRSWELYDLEADPGETRNLAADDRREFQRLQRQLVAWMKGSEWIRKDRAEIEAHNEEVRKALRALGYVE